ncbi:MAG: hypothetical protein JWO00_38 [Candidatus Parcubacteria bacterium]|nr:hypothetical protein [Candidatus Parcubacteria bacterium]
MNTVENKEITLDDLAAMVSKGFLESRNELNEFKIEVRNEFTEFRAEVKSEFTKFRAEVDGEFANVRKDIANLREDVDDLRKTVLLDHGRRLRKIEHKLEIA